MSIEYYLSVMENKIKTCVTCDGEVSSWKCVSCSTAFSLIEDVEDHGCAEGSVENMCVECSNAESICDCTEV